MKRIFTAALVMGIALAVYGIFNLSAFGKHDAPAHTGVVMYESTSTAAAKPRVSYAQFQQQQDRRTVRWIVERFIAEMDGGVRPLGVSHRCILKATLRYGIADKLAKDLTGGDFIAFGRELRQDRAASTVEQYVGYLAGALNYAGSDPAWECSGISGKAAEDARPFMVKNNIIGKSIPRKRRPQADEIERLLAYFAEQNRHPICTTDMVKVTRWQLASARRIGESCALRWEDWNREAQTILVRKMKDPKNRNKQKWVALPNDAQALLVEWYEVRDPNEPRILPFVSKTCSARYTLAKKELAIENLRLHDSRRDRTSRLIEDEGLTAEQATAFTGHETAQILDRTYKVLDPAKVVKLIKPQAAA